MVNLACSQLTLGGRLGPKQMVGGGGTGSQVAEINNPMDASIMSCRRQVFGTQHVGAFQVTSMAVAFSAG